MPVTNKSDMLGAELLVKCLEAQGVEFIFGIPGAKIDAVFNALVDSKIRLVVCRHEQNAAFMAAAYGRMTGNPGVVLVTSGPGVSNLTTGLLTATTEGDPVIAIGANVPREALLKSAHQRADNVTLHKASTKMSVEIYNVDNIPEVIENAFRTACQPRRGACFLSFPQDLLLDKTNIAAQTKLPEPAPMIAVAPAIESMAKAIEKAKLPILLLGEDASRHDNTQAVRNLLEKIRMPVISTYQAAGVVSRELADCFVGRVGLFKNQPGDKLLAAADLVVTVGYNPVEYDPEVWNAKGDKSIVHLDNNPAEIHRVYRPQQEVLGDIAENIKLLTAQLKQGDKLADQSLVKTLQEELHDVIEEGKAKKGSPVHPLRFIYELRQAVDDDTRVICDVGSVYMWFARYFLSYEPHHLLFSNGQQTLGVGLPWAMGVSFANPGERIVSVSGDGGFLFSAMELETAVREKCNFTHFVWQDKRYDMVYEQELTKYNRGSGVDFGALNMPAFAEGFGAKGFVLDDPDDFSEMFKEAESISGPVLINVPIDYSDNPGLFELLHDSFENH
jgi:acetolactate synthase I/II/III large subunit